MMSELWLGRQNDDLNFEPSAYKYRTLRATRPKNLADSPFQQRV